MIGYEVSFQAMGGFFRRFVSYDRRERRKTLEKVAKMLQAEAKSLVGRTSVESAGPYAAWKPLAEATQERRAQLGYSTDEMLLRTGALRDAIEANWDSRNAWIGVPDKTVGGSRRGDHVRNIGEVAMVQEMGNAHVPPRSFLGMAGARKAEEVAKEMTKHIRYGFIAARVETPNR